MKSYSERAEATREKIKAYKNRAKERRKTILIGVVSLCTCMFVVLNVVLLVPRTNYPSGNMDPNLSGDTNHGTNGNGEYAEIIKELSALRAGGGFGGEGNADTSTPDAPGDSSQGGAGSGSSSSGEHYVETTDNQVAGVTEGDLIKRTNKYIYYLAMMNNPTLRVYPIAGTQTECIAEFAVTPPSDKYEYEWNNEMYLSEDGATVTLILPVVRYWWEGSKYYSEHYTEIVNIDVSDHSDIKITERYCVSGTYVSSRLVNGELLLVTNFSVPYYVNFNENNLGQFIPSTGASGEMSCIPAQNIHCPEKPSRARFTVVCSVDAATLQETGSQAFLSYSENVYVSANNIYLTNGYTLYTDLLSDKSGGLSDKDYHVVYETKTEIARVKYGVELNYEGGFTVLGSVLNRFSMDEKDGVLRVVTTPHRYEYGRENNRYHSIITDGASLYCVDIESYETVGKLENFAPENDTVRSVRFDGDKVYVCTAVVMTDPVFAIDISDYNNIRSVDTGEIPGYSIALRKFYGDTLLGIGYDSNGWSERNLKIELYKETENAVESAATFTYLNEGYEHDGKYYEYANVSFSSEYKAYFIDAERGLIGLALRIDAYGCNDYDYNDYNDYNYYKSITVNRYLLLQYDGENLNLLLGLDLGKYANYYFYDIVRAVYVDGAFYVFTEDGLTVTELNI